VEQPIFFSLAIDNQRNSNKKYLLIRLTLSLTLVFLIAVLTKVWGATTYTILYSSQGLHTNEYSWATLQSGSISLQNGDILDFSYLPTSLPVGTTLGEATITLPADTALTIKGAYPFPLPLRLAGIDTLTLENCYLQGGNSSPTVEFTWGTEKVLHLVGSCIIENSLGVALAAKNTLTISGTGSLIARGRSYGIDFNGGGHNIFTVNSPVIAEYSHTGGSATTSGALRFNYASSVAIAGSGNLVGRSYEQGLGSGLYLYGNTVSFYLSVQGLASLNFEGAGNGSGIYFSEGCGVEERVISFNNVGLSRFQGGASGHGLEFKGGGANALDTIENSGNTVTFAGSVNATSPGHGIYTARNLTLKGQYIDALGGRRGAGLALSSTLPLTLDLTLFTTAFQPIGGSNINNSYNEGAGLLLHQETTIRLHNEASFVPLGGDGGPGISTSATINLYKSASGSSFVWALGNGERSYGYGLSSQAGSNLLLRNIGIIPVTLRCGGSANRAGIYLPLSCTLTLQGAVRLETLGGSGSSGFARGSENLPTSSVCFNSNTARLLVSNRSSLAETIALSRGDSALLGLWTLDSYIGTFAGGSSPYTRHGEYILPPALSASSPASDIIFINPEPPEVALHTAAIFTRVGEGGEYQIDVATTNIINGPLHSLTLIDPPPGVNFVLFEVDNGVGRLSLTIAPNIDIENLPPLKLQLGDSVSGDFYIIVEPNAVITITSHPTPLTLVTAGEIVAELQVAATVSPEKELRYLWYQSSSDSNKSGVAIAGATGNIFTLPGNLNAGTYFYFCEVRSSGATPLRSNVAIIQVAPVSEPLRYEVKLETAGSGAVGAGEYLPEATVTVEAGSIEGYTFHRWEVVSPQGLMLSQPNSPKITFTMPAEAVYLRGIFRKITPEYPPMVCIKVR